MHHRFPMSAAALALLLCTAAAFAQAPAAPKPRPEVKRMADMVGTWTNTFDIKAVPGMSAAHKATSTRTCVWTAGGYGVSCKEILNMGAMGTFVSESLMAYDSQAKNYIHTEVSDDGEAFVGRGVVKGDTWVFENDFMMQGKTMHARYTVKYITKDTCEIKYESGADANSMQLAMDGKQTRTKSAAPKPTAK